MSEKPLIDLRELPLVTRIHCAGIPRESRKGRCERPVAEVHRLLGSDDPLLIINVIEVVNTWSGMMRKPKTVHRGRRQALVPADFSGGTDILLCPRPGPKDPATGVVFPSLHNAWYEPDAENADHRRRWFGAAMFDFELLREPYLAWQEFGPQELRWSPASASPILSLRTLEGQFNSVVPLFHR